jgi:adenylate cyclase
MDFQTPGCYNFGRRRYLLKRRLAAILAADVVGYSRLMGLDEADTLARLKSLHRDLVRPNITGRGGRIVKLMGDGLLAEFPSALEAVQCAVDIQRAMPEREAEQPKERRIALRIGVNLGDIVIEGADIFGDGVNVAARLEALAQPGCICVSSTVKDQVRGTLRQEFRDLGEVEVKNIERPIHVFGWPESTRLPPGSARPRTDRSGKPSIAILPFSNMSSMPGQEAFVDGLTEDIITGLSHMRWYDVKARNSTLAFKGTAAGVCEIGRALNVGYVLEGSVRKGETSLRITAKLIDARNGNQIWADRFDRDIGDDFAIQDEIAQRVASILGERIWQDVSKHIGSKRPADYTAYDYAYAAINRLHRLEPPRCCDRKRLFSKSP